jgi:catechol 2,3-dioxygenase-like lactoylglutathione lyase family enzyme
MTNGGHVLEIFSYADNRNAQAIDSSIGNDLPVVGVKHFGVATDVPLEFVKNEIDSRGLGTTTPVTRGRTEITYFFVRDPDGNWLEVVSDLRALDANSPTIIVEASSSP